MSDFTKFSYADLKRDVRKFVANGGKDAEAFIVVHEPEYNRIPAIVIQLAIDGVTEEMAQEGTQVNTKGRR